MMMMIGTGRTLDGTLGRVLRRGITTSQPETMVVVPATKGGIPVIIRDRRIGEVAGELCYRKMSVALSTVVRMNAESPT